jgi:hypothetical protein
MSPRAAWRLDSLGYDTYDYAAGKADWLAHGLPHQGSAQLAGDALTTDVPTCGVQDRLGDVRDTLEASPFGIVAVLNAHGVLMGRLDHEAAYSTRWLETVTDAMEILSRSRTAVSIENPDPPSSPKLPDEWLSQARWRVIAQEFGLNLTYDTSHAAASGWDLLGYAESPDASLDNVHLSDVGGRIYENEFLNSLLHAHRPPGTGGRRELRAACHLDPVLDEPRRSGRVRPRHAARPRDGRGLDLARRRRRSPSPSRSRGWASWSPPGCSSAGTRGRTASEWPAGRR